MLFFTDENHLPEVVFYCRRCEQFVGTPTCPDCTQPDPENPKVRIPTATAPIERNTANRTLWGENLERMFAWGRRGRIIPEVE